MNRFGKLGWKIGGATLISIIRGASGGRLGGFTPAQNFVYASILVDLVDANSDLQEVRELYQDIRGEKTSSFQLISDVLRGAAPDYIRDQFWVVTKRAGLDIGSDGLALTSSRGFAKAALAASPQDWLLTRDNIKRGEFGQLTSAIGGAVNANDSETFRAAQRMQGFYNNTGIVPDEFNSTLIKHIQKNRPDINVVGAKNYSDVYYIAAVDLMTKLYRESTDELKPAHFPELTKQGGALDNLADALMKINPIPNDLPPFSSLPEQAKSQIIFQMRTEGVNRAFAQYTSQHNEIMQAQQQAMAEMGAPDSSEMGTMDGMGNGGAGSMDMAMMPQMSQQEMAQIEQFLTENMSPTLLAKMQTGAMPTQEEMGELQQLMVDMQAHLGQIPQPQPDKNSNANLDPNLVNGITRDDERPVDIVSSDSPSPELTAGNNHPKAQTEEATAEQPQTNWGDRFSRGAKASATTGAPGAITEIVSNGPKQSEGNHADSVGQNNGTLNPEQFKKATQLAGNGMNAGGNMPMADREDARRANQAEGNIATQI